MSKKQKSVEQATKDVRARKRTFSEAEIAELKRTVARQRGRRKAMAQSAAALSAVTDFARARRGTISLRSRAPGSFESKK